jgi:hypothetical protein
MQLMQFGNGLRPAIGQRVKNGKSLLSGGRKGAPNNATRASVRKSRVIQDFTA